MKTFAFASAVRGYHVYQDVWKPSIEEKHNEMVGHLPREVPRIAWYFLARNREISVEVIGHKGNCKRLCGGMEFPCQ